MKACRIVEETSQHQFKGIISVLVLCSRMWNKKQLHLRKIPSALGKLADLLCPVMSCLSGWPKKKVDTFSLGRTFTLPPRSDKMPPPFSVAIYNNGKCRPGISSCSPDVNFWNQVQNLWVDHHHHHRYVSLLSGSQRGAAPLERC